jgi:hypothetical protein
MKKALKSLICKALSFCNVDKVGLFSNQFLEDLEKIYAISEVLPLGALQEMAPFDREASISKPSYIPTKNRTNSTGRN